jgi:hypothetical protein
MEAQPYNFAVDNVRVYLLYKGNTAIVLSVKEEVKPKKK